MNYENFPDLRHAKIHAVSRLTSKTFRKFLDKKMPKYSIGFARMRGLFLLEPGIETICHFLLEKNAWNICDFLIKAANGTKDVWTVRVNAKKSNDARSFLYIISYRHNSWNVSG